MTTFSAIQDLIDRFADDALRTDAGGGAEPRTFPLPLRIDGWNWAQKVLMQHTPLQKSATLSINEGGRSADLPSDFFDMHGIYDSQEGYWWHQRPMEPVGYRDENADDPEFWIWGSGLVLERQLSTDNEDLALYYWAYYPEIEYTVAVGEDGVEDPEDITYQQENVYTPRWSDAAMIHLAASYCWQPGGVEASDINQWNIMLDSGTPMDNPRQAAAWYHYRWWNDLMSKVNPARG